MADDEPRTEPAPLTEDEMRAIKKEHDRQMQIATHAAMTRKMGPIEEDA